MMTLELERVRRKARYAATKLANSLWTDVERVVLGQVTAWEDPKGYSVWEIDRKDQAFDSYIKVMNANYQATVWDWTNDN